MADEDRDQSLSRLIGELLESGSMPDAGSARALRSEGDPFFDALLAYRRVSEGQAARPTTQESARMWSEVEASVRAAAGRSGPDRPPTRLNRRRIGARGWRIAVAMGVVLVAGLLTLLLLQAPDEELLAASQDAVIAFPLEDGSVITLRPNSQLYRLAGTEARSAYRLHGEALFEVVDQGRKVFTVDAGDARVSILGTRFNLSTWGEHTSVYLEEGRIRFENLHSGTHVALEPGQSSRTTAGDGISRPVAEPSDEHLDWLAGEMSFQQRPVRLIIAELELHFGVVLNVPDTYLYETLTGRVLLQTERQSLDDLARVMGGRFVETRPETYRFEPD